ncbi:cytochrome b/b6 domain-containing protein [Flavisolibacter nicotianae]|uniref:cytochrome b/b6 domain-containing protein n=1 Tax=Flavisolibacter nicotianae TaxID=2364882 RepID=UPI000EAD1158|nr:cytochrome b/b6 domain-containing protein [Flavisolibacter nicotianae]
METLTLQRNYSKGIRLWHWSTFLVVTLLLATVLAGKFFLNSYTNGFLIKDRLAKQGVAVNMGEAFSVSDAIGKPIWQLHTVLGYFLAGLFVFRIVIEVFQPKKQTLASRFRKAWRERKGQKRGSWQVFLVPAIYSLFYLLLTAIVASGCWLAFTRTASADAVHAVKEFHQQCFFVLLVFLFVHLAGVIRAERRQHKNLVSAMIHGGELPVAKEKERSPNRRADVC